MREAVRLQQLVHETAPNARLLIATSGAIDGRRSAVKVGDVERTLERRVDCQIPGDAGAALAAVNFGKPLSEAAPSSGIVKALRPLVAGLDSPVGGTDTRKVASLFARLGQGDEEEDWRECSVCVARKPRRHRRRAGPSIASADAAWGKRVRTRQPRATGKPA